MTRAAEDLTERDRRLEEALLVYVEAEEAGQSLDPAEWRLRYPDFTAELEEFLADRGEVRRLVEPLRPEVETIPGPPDASPKPLAAPRCRGPYELLERLGQGGMGVVYRARHLQLGRVVALKMVHAGRLVGEAEVQRFQLEARVVSQLDHPGIVPL